MDKKTVKDMELSGKRVLVRVDFNVPLTPERTVADDTRIIAALPTIMYLMNHNARVILMSHLGRPKGERRPEYSLEPVAEVLSRLLKTKVGFCKDCVGESVRKMVCTMKDGEVILLENVRFYKEETANDPAFAKKLAANADIFVNDAFGAVHRAHASTVGVTEYLPAVAGLLLERELRVLGKVLQEPERPFVAILGGAKVSDKIKVIENLIDKVDCLIIGGGMAFTFLRARGINIGKSLFDGEHIAFARTMLETARRKGVKVMLPIDVVQAAEPKASSPASLVAVEDIDPEKMGLDIGRCTSMIFGEEIKKAQTVIWNGPMGVFEVPAFANGTKELAKVMADCSAMTVVGGGDTAAAVKKFGYDDAMGHISTGGGASLEFLEGRELPGVAALLKK